MQHPDPAKREKNSIHAIVAVFLPLLLISLIRVAGFSSENSVDCYYHIFISDSGPSEYMAKEFPKLTMSTWTNNFSDKELGFHLILSAVRTVKHALGIGLLPPFNLEALIFASLAIISFCYLLWYFRVKNIIYYSLLLIIISPFFTNRLLMLRPHNLSLTLMLFSLPILFSIDTEKKLWRAFMLGFITSWCYSNPHFILLPAFAVSIALYLKNSNRRITLTIPVIVIAGLISGYILHPQFPNTFINWKIQCIDVINQALFHSEPVTIGREFHSPSFSWILKNSMPFILLIFSLLLIYRLSPKKHLLNSGIKKLPPHIIAVGIISIITLSAVFSGIRAMEYAAPFAIIFTALLLNEFYEKKYPFPQLLCGSKVPKYTKILIIVTTVAFTLFQIDKYSRAKGFPPLNDFKKWSETANIPKNAIIANLIWSDFAFLIYSTPQYRYICGQDPMFSYALYPKKMEQLEKLRKEKIKLTPTQLAKLTNANFAFIRKPYKRFALSMIKQGFHPIYSGKDGWLFSNLRSRTEEKIILSK